MAAGTGGGRGGIGWLILAAALAVPGFLFYNWWSHLKAEHDRAISAKAIKRADGGVFQTMPPQSGRLVNPMTPSTGAAAGFAPGAAAPRPAAPALAGALPIPAAPAGNPPAVAAPVGAAAGMAPAKTAPAGAPAAAAMTGGMAPGAPGAGATPAPGATASGVSLSTAATIVLSRDPMMSPLDAVRLQEAALAEEERLRALEEANKPRRHEPPKRRVLPKIESKIELQGIVAKADGDNLAIINGATVNPGESFTVDNYEGKVRVVKITSSEVTLEYKGRKIKLNVNAE